MENRGLQTARVKVLVGVDDEHIDDLAGMIDRLKAAGMQVEDAMETLGTVTGSVESTKLETVRAIEGVSEVEPSRTFKLAPPDSDVQ